MGQPEYFWFEVALTFLYISGAIGFYAFFSLTNKLTKKELVVVIFWPLAILLIGTYVHIKEKLQHPPRTENSNDKFLAH